MAATPKKPTRAEAPRPRRRAPARRVKPSDRKRQDSPPRATPQRRSADRADKSVEQFRDALERSVTLSRERIQEVVDDAVKRGRMTARGRQRDGLQPARPRPQADRGHARRSSSACSSRPAPGSSTRTKRTRKRVEKRTSAARKQAERTARRVAKDVRGGRRRAARAGRQAAPARRRRVELPDHRLRRPLGRAGEDPPRRPRPPRAAQGPHLREEQQGAQGRPRRHREEARR